MDYLYKKLTHQYLTRLELPRAEQNLWVLQRDAGELRAGTEVMCLEVGRRGGDKRTCVLVEVLRVVDDRDELGANGKARWLSPGYQSPVERTGKRYLLDGEPDELLKRWFGLAPSLR